MKRFLIYSVILISTVFASFSCIDLDEEYEENLREQEKYYAKLQEQFGKDTVVIEKYLADSSLTAVKDSSGIYYIIEAAGEELHPDDNSVITVLYKGWLVDGTVFSQTYDDVSYTTNLRGLIAGWRIGIPKIGAGGKIKLFVPSYYGYGDVEWGSVPANSVLIFDIELLSFY